MIVVTMRRPRGMPSAPGYRDEFTFEEPHWSAAKDLIRTLEAQGWAFVSAINPQTWDDGAPHDDPTEYERTVAALARNQEIMWHMGVKESKPPFDPLKAGWVGCVACSGYGDKVEYTGVFPCPACDGLGIVVGPPEDGLELASMFKGNRMDIPLQENSYGMNLIRRANDYKMSS